MKKYTIITYGCQMNVHESEKIAGQIERLGYVKNDDEFSSDLVVLNTCCIRETAEQKAMGNIGALKQVKKKNKNMIIVVCGCMSQQKDYDRLLKEKFPFVDIIIGTANLHKIGSLIEEYENRRKKIYEIDYTEKPEIVETNTIARTSYPHAWVNITYGCNNFCTYCIVPYVRGRERSRDYKDILQDINELLNQGYKEITLLGQNVNSYGSDLDNGVNFAFLLKEIAKIDKKFRLRFMTSHPKDLSSEVVDIIANSKNMCKCIHLPCQAGSTRVLSLMNRRYTKEHYMSLVNMIRDKIPNCAITTDIMVGFPTETEEDFLETMDLVEKCRFSSAFTFIYSKRKGTIAEKMDQIPYKIKQERIERLIKLQNQITAELSNEYVGKTYEVLIDGKNDKRPCVLIGRTDCGKLVNMKGDDGLIGSFVNVYIKSAKLSALEGDIVE